MVGTLAVMEVLVMSGHLDLNGQPHLGEHGHDYVLQVKYRRREVLEWGPRISASAP